MKIVHTSDWHIGKKLMGRDRGEEFKAVLGEIGDICRREEADLLLVAGDVFDTYTPSAEAEEMSPRARDTPRVRPKRCLIDFLMKMLLSDRSLDLCCLNKKWRDINKLYHG